MGEMENQTGALPSVNTSAGNFGQMLSNLTRPQAFPFALADNEAISVIQTHASAVILTSSYAYKLKKPYDFGFFDYSMPALRRYYCQQEVELNTALAPEIYLGIAPVIIRSDKQWQFGSTCSADRVPEPSACYQGGIVMDYAVVMVRLPDEATLATLVQQGTATPQLLAEVAHALAAFHARTPTDQQIASFGSLENICANWEENFIQIAPSIGRTIDAPTYNLIVSFARQFMKHRASLLSERVHQGHIRDCHGDLRLEHVYVLDSTSASLQRQLALLDRIEFNKRFRYGDIASEVAFLAMELDAASRADLAQAFIQSYRRETNDDTLCEVLPFYCCYRACVRGKVVSFQLDQPEVEEVQRKKARQEAEGLFKLAAFYARTPSMPQLLMIGGLMGTGKSTLAHALQDKLGWSLLSSDRIRKQLLQLNPAQPHAEAFGQGIYSEDWTVRVYSMLCQDAVKLLASGHSVLVDASFSRRADRQALAYEAIQHGAQVFFVECICPRPYALQRLEQRWQQRLTESQQCRVEVSSASDGRPDLYDAQRASWQVFDPDREPEMHAIVLDTTRPLSFMLEQIIEILHLPHLASTIS
jgi:aminoglycoside phosphotransferase family enzyme/predicted kinase